MSAINIDTSVHICEDTQGSFDLQQVLANAGFTTTKGLSIEYMEVTLPDGTVIDDNSSNVFSYKQLPSGKWVLEVHADAMPNYNGSFATFEFVVETGAGSAAVSMNLTVVVDPVNDAPIGANKIFADLVDGHAVVLNEADFGYKDPVEGDAFMSVIISKLPGAGKVLLNGAAVAEGAEIPIAEIRAGHLAFEPSQTSAGIVDIGFKVRDNGGTVGCGAADTSAQNFLTFKVPMSHLGDFVWEDSNGNGVQDSGESGIANVAVDLKDSHGNVVASTTTDGSGKYHFDVDPGTYSVSFHTPAGYTITSPHQGGNDATDSDIDAAGNTAPITLAPGETNNKADAGLYRAASLGDTVWYDSNRNGMQDGGEAGVAGVKVTLLDANGQPVAGATATTDANGHYQFSGLKPGSYSVQFDKTTLPDHFVFTASGQGGDATKDSDANTATGQTQQVTLASGDSYQHLDAGVVVVQANLGDRVWEDSNGNGVQDAGEAGIDGVKVELKDAGGHVISTVTHDGGQYSFTVDPGTYSVTMTAPDGYVATGLHHGGTAATDSDIDASGHTAPVTLAAGETNNDIDGGFYRPASLSEIVWFDANRDGRLNNGEVGAAGIKVTLLDASGNPVPGAVAVTDAQGHYQFTQLPPGTYSVQFDKSTLPAGYNFTSAPQGSPGDSDADTGTGKTGQVTLASGEDRTVRAGLVTVQATLGDKVWEDSNGNGVQDADEAGIDGVKVELKDSHGAVVDSMLTHDGGKYSFTVDAGTYSVAVTAPSGYSVTGQGLGGNGALDSDINAAGATAPVVLAPGQVNNDVDAGLYKLAELGDTVWNDSNRNGVQDNNETGRAGVKVTLLDASGAVAGTAVTDANGQYLFNNLKPGTYSVQFDKTTLGTGYVFTSAHTGGNGAVDSDADTGTGLTQQVTLASGASNHDLDAGVVATPATLGDRVWEDSNGNGVQDAGEAGIVGVKVDLKDENGVVVKTTTTGADGKYSFSVDPGKYSVSVTAPAGMTATGLHTGGTGATDSDVDANGQSGQVTLAAGQVNNDIDAGFYKGASLGDKVWLDLNRNGVQDAGEAGVSGIKVILLDAAGNAVGTPATTDANGNYSFTNLKPGTYSVQFDKASLPANYIFTGADQGGNDAADSDANVTTGKTAQVTLASGGSNTTLDAGIMAVQAKLGDTVWEDKNGNGVQDSGEAGLCGVTVALKDSTGKVVATTTTDTAGHYGFTVNPGSYTVQVTAPKDYVFTGKDVGSNDAIDSDFGSTGVSNSVTLAAGDVNNTVDAGLYKTASLGDRVWLDKNGNGVQDSGESGVSDVKLNLYDADGKFVKSVVTDCDGAYLFTGLKPGNYSVQVDQSTLPEGYTITKANAGSSDALDSDFNSAGQSHTVTLASGQVDKTVDLGLLGAATIGDRVWIDKNGNGVQDDGETGKSGVTVELRNADGDVVKTTVTDKDGNYKFNVVAGTYSVDVKAPSGYLFTQKGAGTTSTDSNADSDGHLGSVTLAAGQSNTTMDAGLYQKAAVGDKVWYDTNGNGLQDSGEGAACGVKVTLYNDKGVAVATDTTDNYGKYSFTDLTPGKYSVKFTAPDGYLFTKQDQGTNDAIDSDAGANGSTAQFTLNSGANDTSWDAGLIKAGSIGNRVWEDSNYNGVQDAGEAGIQGLTVKLFDASTGALKDTVVTDKNGAYLFDGLAAGSYKVEVTKADGWFFTKTGGGTDATDSDFTLTASGANTGRTSTITLATGQNDLNEDAGLYRKASIGDKVWRDANHNGIQDTGEEGIGGISVSLFDNVTGKQVGTTIKTDVNGNYKFADLNPGSYYLVFDKTNVVVKFASDHATYNMSDWKWGVKNVGSNDAIDSDVVGDGKALTNVTHTDATTLTSGENDMSWDATITPIAIDLNGDGIHTIARGAMTGSFDLLGTGKAIQSGWLSSSDGFLAIDSNGNGKIDDISELFGGASKGSGFAKLGSYDSNGDGVVDAHDAQYGKLLVWQDANSNGKTDAGELISLKDAGIASLKVAYTELPFLDANNNLHLERSSVTFSSGKTADMTDVYFNVDAADAAAAGVTTPTIADLLQDGAQAASLVGQCPVVHV